MQNNPLLSILCPHSDNYAVTTFRQMRQKEKKGTGSSKETQTWPFLNKCKFYILNNLLTKC